MAQQIVCIEHNVDVDVEDTQVHGRELVFIGWCDEDGGHDVIVME